jgi:hypothetical protein
MRTTIDLPDPLFREVKATAASRGLKLKDFIAAALRGALHGERAPQTAGSSPDQIHRESMLGHFSRMTEGRTQTGPVGKLDRDSLHDRHA